MTDGELRNSLTTLVTETRALRRSLSELGARNMQLERLINRSKLQIRAVAVITVLGLGLTVVVGVQALAQADMERRLRIAITAQETLRSRAVCPLYAEFFKAYHPELKRPGKERADYVATFARLREQAAVLNCSPVRR